MPFRTLGLEPRVLQAVQQAGYTEPTPIQSAAIPQVIAGHDLIGIAQTGTGKTAAFTLPILTRLAADPSSRRGFRVLVIAPTRQQQPGNGNGARGTIHPHDSAHGPRRFHRHGKPSKPFWRRRR